MTGAEMDLNAFFYPESIAIVGASRREGSLGRVFLDKLVQYGYTGKIYPVNPKTPEINGITTFPSVTELPDLPDMAVILVRKELAIDEVELCGKRGIRNIVMITAGFREVGGEGIDREKALMEIVGKYKLRLIGPNCMGIINTDPAVSMNASFSPTEPYVGNVAFISQSGALGVAVLEMSTALRLGFSIFISEGNKADLQDHHFLEYIATQDRSKVVTLYLESIENVSEFRKVAAKLSRRKPVIALKAGSSVSGARAASSHTGALASPDRAATALFKQTGVIRAETVEDMFHYALAFSTQPVPDGNRVAIITNAGGPAIMATDAVEKFGLQMAQLSDRTRKALREFLPEEASIRNPVDMIASANEKTYQQTLSTVLQDQSVDAVFVIIVRPPVNTTPEMIAEKFKSLLSNQENRKPVFIILMANHDQQCGLPLFQEMNLPVYDYPEAAVKSMATMVNFRENSRKRPGKVRSFPVSRNELKHIFETAQREKRENLTTEEMMTLMHSYGLPFTRGKIAQSAEEAVTFLKEVGGPVAMKIESPEITHKSDSGCVILNIHTAKDARKSFDIIMHNALLLTTSDKIRGIFVQEMVPRAHELAIGMKRDPNYGPVIMCGMGGIFIEIINDTSFRIAPVTTRDAREMLQELKSYPLLKGARGQKGADLPLIMESIQKISRLSLDWPEIMELDLNPFIVAHEKKNCKIVDARMRVRVK